ncbi:MAG: DedA family protein [Gammaproteobacteria bacterium]|nr:DedA family protein [Gammaproteobacteria bacterium]MBQ0840372.1 DedA family protein [Gammaproteobacteria bacterium]
MGLAISAFVSSTLLPGASEVLLLWLVEQGESRLLVLLAIASVANTAGGFLTYWMGRWAEKGFERLRHRPPPSNATIDYVRRWGYPVLLLSWLPIVGDGLCLAAGWLQLRWLPSLVFIFIGKALRYCLLVYAIEIIK